MADSLPTTTHTSDKAPPPIVEKDPIFEEWVLHYIPRNSRATQIKFFKRKGTKREVIQFSRQLCDRFGVRFIHVEEMWVDLETLLKSQQTFF